MGAAAVLETAAETPPTVIVVSNYRTLSYCHATIVHPSLGIERDSHSNQEEQEKVAILRKSITKGGL
jgi:hypothetical protein